MDKINLFFILSFKEQTYEYDKKIKELNELDYKKMDTTLTIHFWLLSKYFNLYNFFEYEDKIEKFENAVIYHLPYGKDDIGDEVEQKLLKFKGKIPIVMRSYDAHSPIKLSKKYLTTYHDLSLSYINTFINDNNIQYAHLSYDNYLITQYYKKKNNSFACMILRKENRRGYFEKSESFKEIKLQKTYHLREQFVKYKNIDIYGRNWSVSMINYKGGLFPHIKKYEMVNEYKFNIVLENVILNNYISEKILDTFLSLSVPVYLGSPVIEKYIPKECFVDIRNFKDNDELIKYLENMSEEEYNKYIKNILKYRDDIFDKFSTKNNFAIPVYKWYKEKYNNGLKYLIDDFNKIEQEVLKMLFKKITLKENIRYYLSRAKFLYKKSFSKNEK